MPLVTAFANYPISQINRARNLLRRRRPAAARRFLLRPREGPVQPSKHQRNRLRSNRLQRSPHALHLKRGQVKMFIRQPLRESRNRVRPLNQLKSPHQSQRNRLRRFLFPDQSANHPSPRLQMSLYLSLRSLLFPPTQPMMPLPHRELYPPSQPMFYPP